MNNIALLILRIVCTSFAIILINYLIKKSSALFAASTTYLIPIFAIFWGILDSEIIQNHEIIGLSKLNRIVEHYSRRGAIQENLTVRIHDSISRIIESSKGVAVMIEASHNCVQCRGVGHQGTSMKTSKLSGDFIDSSKTRHEFYEFIKNNN